MTHDIGEATAAVESSRLFDPVSCRQITTPSIFFSIARVDDVAKGLFIPIITN